MDTMLQENIPNAVGIVFNDTFSYKLKFLHGYHVPFVKEEDFAGDFSYKFLQWHFSCLPKEQVGGTAEKVSVAREKTENSILLMNLF